jgi:hypothetical protein
LRKREEEDIFFLGAKKGETREIRGREKGGVLKPLLLFPPKSPIS